MPEDAEGTSDENNSTMPEDEGLSRTERRKHARRFQNRESARRMRARRAEELQELQDQIASLTSQNAELGACLAQIEGQKHVIMGSMSALTSRVEAATLENLRLKGQNPPADLSTLLPSYMEGLACSQKSSSHAGSGILGAAMRRGEAGLGCSILQHTGVLPVVSQGGVPAVISETLLRGQNSLNSTSSQVGTGSHAKRGLGLLSAPQEAAQKLRQVIKDEVIEGAAHHTQVTCCSLASEELTQPPLTHRPLLMHRQSLPMAAPSTGMATLVGCLGVPSSVSHQQKPLLTLPAHSSGLLHMMAPQALSPCCLPVPSKPAASQPLADPRISEVELQRLMDLRSHNPTAAVIAGSVVAYPASSEGGALDIAAGYESMMLGGGPEARPPLVSDQRGSTLWRRQQRAHALLLQQHCMGKSLADTGSSRVLQGC